MSKKAKLRFFGILAVVLGTVLGITILELGVRIFSPQQLVTYRPKIWMPDPLVGHRLASNLNHVINTGERDIHLITDSHGHRIGNHSNTSGAFRILALGDSYLQALQVEYQDTMTARLEQWMSVEMGTPVKVVNTGVSAWNPEHYLVKEKSELSRKNYDFVITFLYTGNDLLKQRRPIKGPRQPTVGRKFRFPSRLDYKEFIDSLVYPAWTLLRQHSHLVVFTKRRLLEVAVSLGVTRNHFPEAFLVSEKDSSMWEVTANVCEEIAKLASSKNIPIFFVLIPTDFQTDPKLGKKFALGAGLKLSQVDFAQPGRILNSKFKERGLRLINLGPSLRNAYSKGIMTNGRVDRHLSPEGHQIVAEALKPILLQELVQLNSS